MNTIIKTIVYSNTIPVVILVIFLVLVNYNPIFNKRQSRLFTLTASTALFMIIVMSCDYIFSLFTNEPFVTLRVITTFINFSVSPLIPLLLDRISSNNKAKPIIYFALIVNIALCVISIPTGIIFSISEHNGYARGPLFFAPFTITIFYTIALLVRSKYKYLRSQQSEKKYLFVVIILLICAMIAEIVFRYRFFVWTTAAISLPLYYLLLNINQAILDPLTKAYNRLMYAKDIERITTKEDCIITLLDINDFKLVNDQFGHNFGDEYLIKLVSMISYHLPSNSSIYRIGGDEFVIISKTTDLSKVKKYLEETKIDALNNQMDFSYGMDLYHKDQDINIFLDHIDKLMYENKRKDKEKKVCMNCPQEVRPKI